MLKESEIGACDHNCPRDRIGTVVMTTGDLFMVDAFTIRAARHSAFQSGELIDQFFVVQKFNTTCIHQW